MVESFFIKFRETLWNWPYLLGRVLRKTAPVSYIFISLIFVLTSLYLLYISNFFNLSLFEGSTYTEGIVASSTSYNPYASTNLNLVNDINHLIFSRLATVLPNGNVQKDLISSWQSLNNATEYIINLKKNIYFQNGKNMTSADVIYSFNFMKDNFPSPSLNNISIYALSKYKIEFKLQSTDVTFFSDIDFNIVPAGSNYLSVDISHIIGSGPYSIAYITKNEIVLNSFDKYYKGSPYFKNFIIKIYNDNADLVNALETGSVDGAYFDMYPNINISKYPNISIYTKSMSSNYTALFFNLNNVTDIKLRNALSYSVNRKQLIQKELSGEAVPVYGPIPQDSWAYDNSSSVDRYHYDIKQAKSDVTSLGTKITIYCESSIPYNVIRYLKKSWSKIGINANFIIVSNKNLEKIIIDGKYQAVLVNIKGSIDPNSFDLWYSKSQGNLSHLNNSQIDQLLVIGATTPNIESRKETYALFQQQLMSIDPAVFLYSNNFVYFVNNKIKGINFSKLTAPFQRYQSVENWEYNNQ